MLDASEWRSESGVDSDSAVGNHSISSKGLFSPELVSVQYMLLGASLQHYNPFTFCFLASATRN